MDEKLKAKWVKALRSRTYRQGDGMLLNRGKYCCLGVLCRIAGAPVALIRGRLMPSDIGKEYSKLLRLSTQKILSNMNDGFGGKDKRSFREIADYIEKHL
jgi:hypothetical protein